MRSIQIFRSGTHRPMQGDALHFSDADLAACAAAYNPAVHEAPIVIGHPATDDPAFGWIKSISFADGCLTAEPDQINPAFAEQVQAGAYKKISASFWSPTAPGNPTPGKWALRHVGFLGAQPPSVKGLRAVQFAGDVAGVVSFGDSSWAWGSVTRLLRGLREWIIDDKDLATADRVLPMWDIDSLAAAGTEPVTDSSYFAEPSPTKTEPAVDPTEQAAALAARTADLDAREARLAAAEAARADAARVAFAEGLVADGRLLPAERRVVVEVLASLGAAGVVQFAEAEGGAAAPTQPEQLFRSFLTALPPRVDFAERTPKGTGIDPGNAQDLASAAEELIASEKSKGRVIGAADAVGRLTRGAK